MVKKIESRNLIVQSNQLIEANRCLTKKEQKIIYKLMMAIDKDDEEFKPYIFDVSEFAKMLEIKDNNIYKSVRETTKSLQKKILSIKYPNQKRFIDVSWISSADYHEGQGFVILRFDPNMKPFLLQIKEAFTKIDGYIAMQLKSIYSMRFYELLSQYISIGERIITVEDLRKMLGIPDDKYKDFSDFRKRVIQQAQKEINKHPDMDLFFEFEQIKTGRSVTSIRFIIRKKFVNTNKYDCKVSKNDFQSKKELAEIEVYVNKFNEKYNTQLAINPVKGLVNKKGLVHIENTFTLFDAYVQLEKTKGEIKSLEGFFIYVCNNGYHFSTSIAGTQGYSANFDQRDPSEIDYEQYYYKVSEDE